MYIHVCGLCVGSGIRVQVYWERERWGERESRERERVEREREKIDDVYPTITTVPFSIPNIPFQAMSWNVVTILAILLTSIALWIVRAHLTSTSLRMLVSSQYM